jgi:hypothetical protein
MDYIDILKIQASRVLEDFKLNPWVLKKRILIQKWKMGTVESLIFFIFGQPSRYPGTAVHCLRV